MPTLRELPPCPPSSQFSDEINQALEDGMDRLQRRAFRLTRSKEAADDLIGDTLERAVRKWQLYQSGTNMKAWLLGIMRNVHITNHRRTLSKITPVSFDQSPSLQRENQYLAQSAEEKAMENLGIQVVDEELSKIPPGQRNLINLVDRRGLSYKQAAEVLGIPIGSVASGLNRGRGRLAKTLKEWRAN